MYRPLFCSNYVCHMDCIRALYTYEKLHIASTPCLWNGLCRGQINYVLFSDYSLVQEQAFTDSRMMQSNGISWEENNKREWAPPIDSYTKCAHELCLGYSPLTSAIGRTTPNHYAFCVMFIVPVTTHFV